MAQTRRLDQFPNEVDTHSPQGITFSLGNVDGVVPTGAGYAPGCIYSDIVNGALYINIGTNTVANFVLIASATSLPLFVAGNAPVVIPAATTTYTMTPAVNAGRLTVVAPTGGLTITPAAFTGTGNVYKVVCAAAVTGGSLIWDSKAGNASDLLYGYMNSVKTSTFAQYNATPGVSSTNRITFNGTTTGGAAIGDWFSVTDVGTNIGQVIGFTVQSGTVATPFDTH